MKQPKSHVTHVCAVTGCNSSFPYDNPNIRLFRFPKELQRCRQWATACGVLPLFETQVTYMNKSLYHSYYRVCNLHFEESMYAGETKRRLRMDAVPTLCLKMLEIPKIEMLKTELPEEIPEELPDEYETLICKSEEQLSMEISSEMPSMSYEFVNIPVCNTGSPSTSHQLQVKIEESLPNSPPKFTSSRSTQTEKELTSLSPTKEELRKRIRMLQIENMSLKKQLVKERKKNIPPLWKRISGKEVKTY